MGYRDGECDVVVGGEDASGCRVSLDCVWRYVCQWCGRVIGPSLERGFCLNDLWVYYLGVGVIILAIL